MTIQGELIRAIEKLRDEAQRNGNINRDDGHQIMLAYVAEILLNHVNFTETQRAQIIQSLTELADPENVIIDDTLYNFLSERAVDWYLSNQEKNTRLTNPVLKR